MTDRPSQEPPEVQVEREADEATRQQLSSLADGDAGAAGDGTELALTAWRRSGEARAAWHRYQLIGDVLRSEDLARPARHDEAFLQRLRARLDAEPTVLAPPAATAEVTAARRAVINKPSPMWLAPAAAAAGAAFVAVSLWVTRTEEPGSMASPSAADVAAHGDLGVQKVSSGGVLRDPRLDEFLRMHQMARGGQAVGVPGGTLQRADLQMPVEAPR